MEIRKLKFIFEVWFAFWPGLVFFFLGVWEPQGNAGKRAWQRLLSQLQFLFFIRADRQYLHNLINSE